MMHSNYEVEDIICFWRHLSKDNPRAAPCSPGVMLASPVFLNTRGIINTEPCNVHSTFRCRSGHRRPVQRIAGISVVQAF